MSDDDLWAAVAFLAAAAGSCRRPQFRAATVGDGLRLDAGGRPRPRPPPTRRAAASRCTSTPATPAT